MVRSTSSAVCTIADYAISVRTRAAVSHRSSSQKQVFRAFRISGAGLESLSILPRLENQESLKAPG